MNRILLAVLAVLSGLCPAAFAGEGAPGTGALRATTEEGRVVEFPLRHTGVDATVTGAVADVKVTQVFANPFEEPIEAVYVFPLPEDAAVVDMLVEIGARRIRGLVKPRKEAEEIYEKAKAEGKTAGLLTEERPNLFTQTIANLLPGEEIRVEIRYFERLTPDHGRYSFVFPMVVGPRYVPAGTADPDRIASPALPPGTRSGHNVSVRVRLDAGAAVGDIGSESHEVRIAEPSENERVATLAPGDTIPNRDFVLAFRLSAGRTEVAVLAHRTGAGGWLTLRVEPPEVVATAAVRSRELVFVLDCSGSMSGAPIETAKRVILRCLDGLRPDDTFRILRFSESASRFAPAPVAPAPDVLGRARAYVGALAASGGTRMIEGIRAALAGEPADGRLRIVYFLTDGFIGNEAEILGEVGKLVGEARIFPLGVGSAPNRYLLEEMAREGRGAVRYVRQDASDERVRREVERFFERTARPILTDLEIDWHGLPVAELYPEKLPDLFAGQPIELIGRYTGAGAAEIVLTGRRGGAPWRQTVTVRLPEREEANEVLAPLWARARIAELSRGLHGDAAVEERERIEREITDLAVEFRLASPFTAFVAVDERVVVDPDGTTRTVVQPLPLPEGTSYEGFFGGTDRNAAVGIGGGAGGHRNLRAEGGGAATEAAVDLGAEWMKNHQSPDGSWDADGFSAHCKLNVCDGAGTADRDPAVTALGLLTYLGAGDTHKHGHHKETVKEAMKYLKRLQGEDGRFGSGENHALPALAICEAWALTASPLFEASAKAGLRAVLDRPDEFLADPEVVLWAVAALKSGKDAKIVAEADFEAARAVAEKHLPPGARGELVRIFLGRTPAPEAADAARPTVEEAKRIDPVEFWARTLVAWHRGGDAFKRWTPLLKAVAAEGARRDGDEKGSFDPVGPAGTGNGRVGTTALRTLCAQIYYRYGRTFGTK